MNVSPCVTHMYRCTIAILLRSILLLSYFDNCYISLGYTAYCMYRLLSAYTYNGEDVLEEGVGKVMCWLTGLVRSHVSLMVSYRKLFHFDMYIDMIRFTW